MKCLVSWVVLLLFASSCVAGDVTISADELAE